MMMNIYNIFTRQYILLFSLVFISLFIINVEVGVAQSRNAIGFRFDVNKPYADVYKFGTGGAIQLNIAFNAKWGFDASLNYDKINGNKSGYYYLEETGKPPIFYTSGDAESLNLIHIDLAARYYIIPNLFAKLGPVFYLASGNEDLTGLGIGGTAAVGYQLLLNKRNKLEFIFNTDLIDLQYGSGTTPIAGFKIAYAFNFSGS